MKKKIILGILIGTKEQFLKDSVSREDCAFLCCACSDFFKKGIYDTPKETDVFKKYLYENYPKNTYLDYSAEDFKAHNDVVFNLDSERLTWLNKHIKLNS